jgi:hypothetical protein
MTTENEPVQQWEYTLTSTTIGPIGNVSPTMQAVNDSVLSTLNELGAQGWEAVGPVALVSVGTGGSSASQSVLLKRPKR